MSKRVPTKAGAILGAVVVCLAIAATAYAMQFTSWSEAQKIDTIAGNHPDLNTAALDGCPIQSPDGLSLYQASNRPGSQGLDIWVATRESTDDGFGAPVNIGAPINTAYDDFCPTPVRGNGLFFVSRKPGGCGLGDIYFTRRNPKHGWSEPVHLGCTPNGPNGALDEQGPSYFEADGHGYLYFSRSAAATQPGGPVAGDIYAAPEIADGVFGAASAVTSLNDATANDIQPNVRKDGRELVFSSNRTGAAGQDVYTATRDSASDPWSAPVNLGPNVNTAAGETRPSLSWHAEQLLFGRAPSSEGSSDIYVSTREKANGN